MIKKATINNIHDIEGILFNTVIWMKENNIPNLWNADNICWTELSKSYNINDFYIYYLNNNPVGCMALTNVDEKWEGIEISDSIYIHKLAVKREASGNGISKKLLDYAKSYAHRKGVISVRLNCNANRQKLRSLYEQENFQYIKTITDDNNYHLALYSCEINK